jgi:hypothetical protein
VAAASASRSWTQVSKATKDPGANPPEWLRRFSTHVFMAFISMFAWLR